MSDQSKMSYQPMLGGLIDAISLPGSESGITPLTSPDGPMIDECGREVVLASLSARQAKERGLLTSGTYGLRGSIFSESADLTQSLANRLRVKTDSLGSTLFRLTWKASATASGRLIFRLRASVPRISDRDYSSWPTPMAGTPAQNGNNEAGNTDSSRKIVALMTHWEKTPHASDGEGGVMEIRPEANGHYKLRDLAHVASWKTPRATDGEKGGPNQMGSKGDLMLPSEAQLSSWSTPNCDDANNAPRESGVFKSLTRDALLTGWTTPTVNDAKNNGTDSQMDRNSLALNCQASLTDSGTMPSGSTAETENTARLNPAFSLWLMGLPAEWHSCGVRAMRSRRKSPKRSSKVT